MFRLPARSGAFWNILNESIISDKCVLDVNYRNNRQSLCGFVMIIYRHFIILSAGLDEMFAPSLEDIPNGLIKPKTETQV